MEKVRARVYTVNMFHKKIIFTLWEDDAKGSGHNANNQPIQTLPPVLVDKDGIATGEFTLTRALMQKAMKGETDAKELEFYVTVEYYTHKKHPTNNVNVANPLPQQPKPVGIPKASGSPAAQKGKSKMEEKGFVETMIDKSAELWDYTETKGTATKEQPPTIQKQDGNSPAMVREKKVEEKEECVCKKYDLIWGGHPNVNCAFRKKVVEICADLWGDDNKIIMANNLMAVFRWESGGTFKPDVPNQANSGGTGLIQFMPSTAKSLLGREITVETVKNYFGQKYNKKTKQKEDWHLKRVKEFADMTAIEQLDYVKKYFEPLRGKTVEFVDFYCKLPQKQYGLKVDKMFNFKTVKDEKEHIQSCADCGHFKRV